LPPGVFLFQPGVNLAYPRLSESAIRTALDFSAIELLIDGHPNQKSRNLRLRIPKKNA